MKENNQKIKRLQAKPKHCRHNIYNKTSLREIIEYNKSTYLCYVELRTAIDKVTKTVILKVLENPVMHPNITYMIKDINDNYAKKVIIPNETTEHVIIKSRIK